MIEIESKAHLEPVSGDRINADPLGVERRSRRVDQIDLWRRRGRIETNNRPVADLLVGPQGPAIPFDDQRNIANQRLRHTFAVELLDGQVQDPWSFRSS